MRIRLQGAERKRSIIHAARVLFADKGFNGTSVRDIARSAGVSEALLYKHFPDKKQIYNETMDYLGDLKGLFKVRLDELEPGSETLVIYVFLMVRLILLEVPGMEKAQYCHERLLFRSLIGDTTFARRHLKNMMDFLGDRLSACVDEANLAGEMTPGAVAARNSIWFAHHLAMSLNLCHLSGDSVFSYDVSKTELINQAVRFILRGMGMKEDAIDSHFQPDKLEKFFQQIYG
jgi:AcrR family transcriptional regulator